MGGVQLEAGQPLCLQKGWGRCELGGLTAPPSPKIKGLCERWCDFLPAYPARFTWLKETEGEVGKQRVKE